ncbi:mannose-1-phosphate guanylyltransferase/mannose-6-phosphate isomerase [bacterium]|nr:mannose-1-phosphate guanylyltransferase/mannose-6-phosphate isomerase [bacterium]
MFGIILAGGSGSRLWPLSRELHPKQLLNLTGEKSLLQTTFERLQHCMPNSNIISITNTKHAPNIRVQLKELAENLTILSEPVSKNTAPAIALSAKYIEQNYSNDEIILAVPSDHIINNIEKFKTAILEGEKLAKEGHFVTFGVQPTYCETGFGYIKTGEKISNGYKVIQFSEKPNTETAKKYLEDKTYFWNSGIFMFKSSTLFDELHKHAPEIFKITEQIDMTNSTEIPFVEFDKMPNISIDYALMEKSDKLAMIKLESDWKDLGSWDAIYNMNEKDENNNVLIGHVLNKESKNCLVYSSSKLVTTIGLEDTVIVETEDAILACKKDKTQEVKQIYETLKEQNDNTHFCHKTVYRPWGFYTVIAQGTGFQSKIIHVNPKQKLSLQSHNHRSEHWVVLSGTAKVVLGSRELILNAGHSVDIPLKAIHSLQNPYEEPVEVIEVQKGDILLEEDIIRYEDMYGRV